MILDMSDVVVLDGNSPKDEIFNAILNFIKNDTKLSDRKDLVKNAINDKTWISAKIQSKPNIKSDQFTKIDDHSKSEEPTST